MAYIDYEYYKNLYENSAITKTTFDRLSYDAGRKIDAATTGVDSVKKLKIAFPVNEDDAEAVKRCVASLISLLYRIEQAEETALDSRGYMIREDGTLQGKIVSSVSAGSESISYSDGSKSGTATLIDKALSDKEVQRKLYYDTITEYLSGVPDANGVNLLYMGRYPFKVG